MSFMNLNTPNIFPYAIPEGLVGIDRSRIVTHPVRRYLHGGHVQYTVLACADYRTPHKIFYDLEISRPHDIEFPTSPYKDMKIFKQLVKEFPIPDQAYIKAEKILRKKIDETRIKVLQQRRMELLEKTRMELMTKEQNEILTKKANEYKELMTKALASCETQTAKIQAAVDNMVKSESDVQNMTKTKVADEIDSYTNDGNAEDTNDDDYSRGILGVYCRSEIHCDYSGTCGTREG